MFLKPNAIVYVRRGSLLIAGKRLKPARLNFPAEATTNLEVIDADVLGTLCMDFFASNGLKGQRVLVVLDHSIVFAKSVALTTASSPAQLTKDFNAQIPFEPGNRVCLSLQTPTSLRLFAIGVGMSDVIAQALGKAGVAKIIAITPVAAYGIRDSEQLNSGIVDKLLRDTTVRTKANFQTADPF